MSTQTTTPAERLRTEKMEFDAEMRVEGNVAGQEAARDGTLSYRDLWRLNQHHQGGQLDLSTDAAAANVVACLGSEHDSREFWEAAVGDPNDVRLGHPEFVAGFVDGALEVFAGSN